MHGYKISSAKYRKLHLMVKASSGQRNAGRTATPRLPQIARPFSLAAGSRASVILCHPAH